MQNKDYYSYIFDCDGVILDSNKIKTEAFREVLKDESNEDIESFIKYHKSNQGINRYEKFKYFFEQIKNINNYDKKYNDLLNKFSSICFKKVCSSEYTKGIINYLEQLKLNKLNTFVISGSDEKELIEVFRKKKILGFFNSVYGSPRNKNEITEMLFEKRAINSNSIYFGDSKYDYEVAYKIGCKFVFISGYSDWQEGKDFCKKNNIVRVENFLNINEKI